MVHLVAGGKVTYCKCGKLNKMLTLLALADSGLPTKCECGKELFRRLPQLKGTTFILLEGGPIKKPQLQLDLSKLP